MIESFAQFCRWILWRFAGGCVLAALALGAWAWLSHSRDTRGGAVDFQARRAELLAGLAERRAQAEADAAAAGKRADDLQTEARAQEQAAADAARAADAHRALQSSWQRWFGDREQQEANDSLLAEAEKKQSDATARAAAIKAELADASLARERAGIEVARARARSDALEKTRSEWEYYALAAWERGRLVAAAIVVFWILWVPARRVFLFYFVAPFVVRRKALRLAAPPGRAEGVEQITTSDAGRTVTVALGAGEVLRVKPELVESADDGLARRDGRRFATTGALFPLTKLVCGLTRLAELRKTPGEPESRAPQPPAPAAAQPAAVDAVDATATDAAAAEAATADSNSQSKCQQTAPALGRANRPGEPTTHRLTGTVRPAFEAISNASWNEAAPANAVADADTSTRMVVLRGMGKWKGAGPDLRKRRAELVMVIVPRGASLALRPRYLAGAVCGEGEPLAVRARWRFFDCHAWVTGQFRVLQFMGPCRLILAGQRGVGMVWIDEREDGLRPVAREEPWAVMGFDAALRYRPARAPAFWGYCKGARPLYDDLFIGTGMYFAQTTPPGEGRYDTGRLRQFFAARWRGFQKLFGC